MSSILTKEKEKNHWLIVHKICYSTEIMQLGIDSYLANIRIRALVSQDGSDVDGIVEVHADVGVLVVDKAVVGKHVSLHRPLASMESSPHVVLANGGIIT
jgi:hypothetical protein